MKCYPHKRVNEKATNNAQSLFSDIKEIHDLMKNQNYPIDIEYDGPYAEISLPSNILKRLSGNTNPRFATITWDVKDDEDGVHWNMNLFLNQKKVLSTIKKNEIVNKLIDAIKKMQSAKK